MKKIRTEHAAQVLQSLRGDWRRFTENVDVDLLIRYVVGNHSSASPVTRNDRLTDQEILFVQEMVAVSPQWKEVLDDIKTTFSEIMTTIEESGIPDRVPRTTLVKYRLAYYYRRWREFFFPPELIPLPQRSIRFVLGTASIAFTLYLVLLVASIPSHKASVELAIARDVSVTRGAEANDDAFLPALLAFQREEFSQAIELADGIARNTTDIETQIRSQIIRCDAFLRRSESHFLGLFPHHTTDDVLQSITAAESIQRLLGKSMLAEDERAQIFEHSQLFLAKGYLLLNDTERARNYLLDVIRRDGPYRFEAERILGVL